MNLKHVFNNPFHGHDLNGKRSRLKEEEGVGRLFLNLWKLCKKMFLDIFKLFPHRFRDATALYFYPIEKRERGRGRETTRWAQEGVNVLFKLRVTNEWPQQSKVNNLTNSVTKPVIYKLG